MKRLLVLFVLAALAGAVLAGPARRLATRSSPAAAPAALPTTSLTLFLGSDGLQPEQSEVPKDHRVSITVANHTGRAVTLALAGYEGRLDIGRIEDGETWCGGFTSELPGDDFAWLVDGKPAGRLAVTGSHLTEGRR